MNSLLEAPKHGDLVYDIGLHRGEDTDFYLRKGFRVVAIEADPDLVLHCRRRFADPIREGRLSIIEGAVVDPMVVARGGKVTFFKNEDNSVWGTVCAEWAARNERRGSISRTIMVDAIGLVDVIASHGIPHYAKIDIEGADLCCLEAFAQFRLRPSYLSIESDRGSYQNLVREIDQLAALGYDAFQAIEQARLPKRQRPPRPAREGEYVDYRFESGASGLFGAELPGRWRSREGILHRYRLISLGYYLFDKDGLTRSWRFPGAGHLRTAARRATSLVLRVPMASWYDTHARHSSVTGKQRLD